MMRLLRLTADAGTLVVAALHDLGLAARYSNTVLAMQDGRVIAQGPPETVLTRELIERAFGLRRRGGDDFGPVWEAVPGAPRDE